MESGFQTQLARWKLNGEDFLKSDEFAGNILRPAEGLDMVEMVLPLSIYIVE